MGTPLIPLRILKWHFVSISDDRGLNEARGYACEIVAWRILHHLSEHELIDYLLQELPAANQSFGHSSDPEANTSGDSAHGRPSSSELVDEQDSLLREHRVSPRKPAMLRYSEPQYIPQAHSSSDGTGASFEEDPISPFMGLNALEIAAVAGAKKFLSQPMVQKIVNSIWYIRNLIISWVSLP